MSKNLDIQRFNPCFTGLCTEIKILKCMRMILITVSILVLLDYVLKSVEFS